MISEHVSEWLGFPVKEYREENAQRPIEISGDTIYRLALDYDAEGTFEELLKKFLRNAGVENLQGIIVGQYFADDGSEASTAAIQALAAANPKLPNLRAIFVGDLISEESEISWINQDDVSPLLSAYPALEHLRLRGGNGLKLGNNARHEKLKSLTIETGGMDRGLFNEVVSGDFPALEHLELWLGSGGYGGTVTIADLRPLLSGQLFPRLRYLGLRNAEDVDEIAAIIGTAPILDRILTLDLSLGDLSDEGGQALLGSDRLKRLRTFDLHHHFLSDELVDRLKSEYPNADLSDQKEGDKYGGKVHRYIAVSE